MNRGRSARIYLIFGMVCWMLGAPRAGVGDDWLPVSQEELKMTSEPLAPGAPAIFLFRKVDRDDATYHENDYARIKILTEEGRKYANVELAFDKKIGNIRGIKARTIRPDGSIENFDGKIYEQTIAKAKGLKFLAKTFTLPNVQVGSIIEYRYVSEWNEGWVYDSHWILSEELFTKRGSFSLKPNQHFAMRTTVPSGLPPGASPPKDDHGAIRLEAQNIPAFHIEDFMPPENELKFRVDFIYLSESNEEKEPDKFWKKEGQRRYNQLNEFTGKRKAMEEAISQIVAPGDSPETKLRKIYARVQQLRNLSAEPSKTEEEMKRNKLKSPNNVEEVWKNGYAYGRDIDWLFLALVRAAGLEAYPILVSDRSNYFFKPGAMNPYQLNDNLVLVKLNGKDLYFDPGTPYASYGLLPWPETAVAGLRLEKDGGGWIQTPAPESSDGRIVRKAVLKLNPDTGGLEGKLTVTYSGHEALEKRLEERIQDDAQRKKLLEDLVREYIPAGIEVELTNKPDWKSSASTLVAEYDLKVPGWVAGAGRRVLMPVGLFGNTEKHVFEHSGRVHPIYFEFPFEKTDDITIELPLGWKTSSLPPATDQNQKYIGYSNKVEEKSGTLHLTRTVRMGLLLVDQKNYPALRDYFQIVKTYDEQQIVLQPGS
jgi:hypothetical protein